MLTLVHMLVVLDFFLRHLNETLFVDLEMNNNNKNLGTTTERLIRFLWFFLLKNHHKTEVVPFKLYLCCLSTLT